MNTIHNWINTALIVVVLAMVLVGGNQSVTEVRYEERDLAGVTNLDTLQLSDGITIGTNGTSIAGVVAGSCTIRSGATTIAASTTQQVDCQSATNGGLSSGLTGVTADSICSLQHASSTSVAGQGLGVFGVSASSTAGSIVAQLSNLTGGTFTWSAAASSSSQWKYSCIDPS